MFSSVEFLTAAPRCWNFASDTNCVFQTNQTSLNVTFSLEKWPRSCCQFDAEVNPSKSLVLIDISVLLSCFSTASAWSVIILKLIILNSAWLCFSLQIKPLFPKCGQDCVRRRRTLNICPGMIYLLSASCCALCQLSSEKIFPSPVCRVVSLCICSSYLSCVLLFCKVTNSATVCFG